MSQLCALADVKTYLGITNTNQDAVITSLITNASAMIESYCNRVFASANYAETRNGTGGYRMYAANAPITAVSAVTVDGISIPAAPAPSGNGLGYGFVFDSDLIYIRPGVPYSGQPTAFNKGIQNVTLAYTAGFTTIPSDVNQACVELVADKLAKQSRIDKKSETLGQQQTVSFDLSDMPPRVKTALAQWRRWPA